MHQRIVCDGLFHVSVYSVIVNTECYLCIIDMGGDVLVGGCNVYAYIANS